MHTARIVAGYDGSAESLAAVDWAAAEAERTGAPLQVINAYRQVWPAAYYDVAPELTEAANRQAETLVGDAVARVRGRGTGIDVIGTAVDALPAATLLDVGAAGARLLVVGNRGAGGLTNLLMGSVSQQVATHASVPVAVVRGRSTATGGPVVAGTDDSPGAGAALALAFEAARARGAGLVAIRAYVPPVQPVLPYSEIEAQERAALEASVAGWAAKYPDVAVETRVAVGRAAKVLIGVSHTAQLVVVGSRGHGGFTGLLLGSVGQQLMHHAECPVLIGHA
ncbi:universal stress protein [Dactylosporangium sp. AC04546]|uniref:universal stress protein n=1 Tax=Dactylosporangium sp. AC04546 TaxID=2862460 RepID=UPI001EE0AF0A|nr:universal stress protein [Dactylosporangium sp. AC04546]WVK78529.1 universal stress protein [Dactylosporangium sp. AC04546]